MKQTDKPIGLIDFDGVIHSYTSGWKGAAVIPDNPVKGAKPFISSLRERFRIVIFSTRAASPEGVAAMKTWLRKHDIPYDDITACCKRRETCQPL